MSDRVEPLAGERQPRETSRAVQACNDWLRMGAGRSLAKLLESYTETDQNEPLTRSMSTIKGWSTRYGWTERAELYDAEIEKVKTARAKEIMETGLALAHNRVLELKRQAECLIEEAAQMDNVWLHDVKQVGSGDNAERVNLVRFNAPLLEQLRRTLDDLAKETGGRVHKVAPTTPDGKEPYDPGADIRETILSRLSRLSDSPKEAADSNEPE